jgi:hypothetical protein
MSDKKIDYRAEGSLFLKLKESGEKVNQVEFCKRRSEENGIPLSLAYFRKVLRSLQGKSKPSKKVKKSRKLTKGSPKTRVNLQKRKDEPSKPLFDWQTLKVEFMKGEHKTLSALARAYGMKPESGEFRRNTKDWRKEKAAVIAESNKKTIQTLVEDRAADKARDLYAEMLVTQWKLMDILNHVAEDVDKGYAAEEKEDGWTIPPPKSAAESKDISIFLLNMQKVIEKVMPNIQGLEKMSDMRSIFDGLGDGTMDIEEAAIGFVRLGVQMPEPLKMMLQKHQPEEATPDDGDEITEAEILARRQEMMIEIETERVEFVSERKKAVVQIKKEMAHVDSFGEGGDGPKEKQ